MRPKKWLVVAERTKSMSMKQEIDEPMIKYLHCLRNASGYCEFEKLGQEHTIDEDLIQLKLTEGMYNASHRYKIMEQLKIGKRPDIGLAVRVFANGPGDLGSIPGRVIPKTQKMVLDAALLNTLHYKVWIKGKVEQSWERSSALPYTLV